MTQIVLPSELDVEKITYSTPVILSSGGKMIGINFNESPLVIQTPEMPLPFGISKWSANNGMESQQGAAEKYTLDLSFRGKESNEVMNMFFNKLRSLDKKFVEDGLENSTLWFKKKYGSREVVEALFTPIVKFAKDENGEPSDKYPPTFKVNLPVKNGEYDFKVFDVNRQPSKILLSDTLKGARVRAIVRCNGIWVAGSKFGVSWRVLQMIVMPSVASSFSKFAFKDVPGEVSTDAHTKNLMAYDDDDFEGHEPSTTYINDDD